MALRDRLAQMGMFPDIGKLTDMFNEKFDKLYAVLIEIRDELRTQRGSPQ